MTRPLPKCSVSVGDSSTNMDINMNMESTTSTLTLTLLAAPDEAPSLAILEPGERSKAAVVQCVAGPTANGPSDAPNAFGDIDVVVIVKCEVVAATPGTSCKC